MKIKQELWLTLVICVMVIFLAVCEGAFKGEDGSPLTVYVDYLEIVKEDGVMCFNKIEIKTEEVCTTEEVDLDWEEKCLEMVEDSCFSPYYNGVEWLDENCECVGCREMYEGKDFVEKGAFCDCQKYKCGEYTVEVL